MSSVDGVGSSSYSSIYGNRNIFSGLASGMDTESMIENSIAGYQTKIQNLINQQTKLTWKQDAFRSITDKMVTLSQKYSSYTSNTNLASPSFFNKAVSTTTNGKNADRISASGKTSSDVKINAVKQMATAARYSVSANKIFGTDGTATGETLNLSSTKLSNISGGLTLTVGNHKVDLEFGENETFENAQELAAAIQKKLGDQTINGEAASKYISVSDGKDGTIQFSAGSAAGSGDSVWISSAGGNIKSTLGITAGALGTGDKSITVPGGKGALYSTMDSVGYLSHKTLDVTLDGVTKKISLGNLERSEQEISNGVTQEDKLLSNLRRGLKDAFGSKVSVDMKDGALSFSAASQGSSLKVSSKVGSALGLGSDGVANYIDTSKTLGKLTDAEGNSIMDGLKAMDAVGTVRPTSGGKGTDEKGNTVMRVGGGWKRVNNDGDLLYSVNINGKDVGGFTKDTTLESVISAINNSDAGVKASYSKLTNKFTFTATETGSEGKIEFGEGLGRRLFGSATPAVDRYGSLLDENGDVITGETKDGKSFYIKQDFDGSYYQYLTGASGGRGEKIDANDPLITQATGFTAGKDAIFNVSVNGEELELTRSSNTVEIDGLSITLKGTFNEEYQDGKIYAKDSNGNPLKDQMVSITSDDQVSFTTKSDADVIVDAIKGFVEEYNAIITEVRSAYNTRSLTTSSGASYEPLTDEDKADMSDSAVEAYEKKAKTGILFGDTDLRRAYDGLYNAITVYGDDRKAMEAIGLTTTYSEGVTTLALDEAKLREALNNNPDSVVKAFTESKETGGSTNGIIARVRKTMDTFASTSIGNYGVLVSRAGTTASARSLLNNSVQKQIDALDDDIDKWQERMSDKVDYYTRQFTQMEKLMSQMNSQSSTLAGLMGY